ncbi:hypothetical protein CEC48_24565 [Pseudomonas sp. K2I15]|nr:hypothetical protein CEC48_24565 [Pseudomonas sp. K2I15]
MLAKVVNDDDGFLIQRGALTFFASKPAPTDPLLQKSSSAFALDLALASNTQVGFQATVLLICC